MSIESVMPFNHGILCRPLWLHSINFSSLQPTVIIALPCSVVSLCCCSVTKLYWTLCDPVNCSMPGLSAHHYLPECSNLCPLSQWYHPTISSSVAPFSFCPQFLPASGLFQWVSSLHQVAKVLELQLQHQSIQWIFRIDFFSIDCFDLFASFFNRKFSYSNILFPYS